MSDTIKIIIVVAATLIFFIGAFVAASKLFGPHRQRVRRQNRNQEELPLPAPQSSAERAAAPAALPPTPEHGVQPQVNITPALVQPPVLPVPAMPAPQAYIGAPAAAATDYTPIAPAYSNNIGSVSPSGQPFMRITIINDNGAPAYSVDVNETDFPVSIGRGINEEGGRSIVVSEPTVSVQHVRLLNNNGTLSVCDYYSTCGTIVNSANGSAVMKNPNRMTVTAVQSDRFDLVLGRMTARVEVLAPIAGRSAPSCRILLTATHNSYPARQATFTRSFSIGRQTGDFILPDPTVSGHHADVTLTPDGRFVLTDCNSTNGTFDAFSGNQITTVELHKGTVLNLGDTQLTVTSIERSVPSATPSTPPKTVYFDSTQSAYNPYN